MCLRLKLRPAIGMRVPPFFLFPPVTNPKSQTVPGRCLGCQGCRAAAEEKPRGDRLGHQRSFLFPYTYDSNIFKYNMRKESPIYRIVYDICHIYFSGFCRFFSSKSYSFPFVSWVVAPSLKGANSKSFRWRGAKLWQLQQMRR